MCSADEAEACPTRAARSDVAGEVVAQLVDLDVQQVGQLLLDPKSRSPLIIGMIEANAPDETSTGMPWRSREVAKSQSFHRGVRAARKPPVDRGARALGGRAELCSRGPSSTHPIEGFLSAKRLRAPGCRNTQIEGEVLVKRSGPDHAHRFLNFNYAASGGATRGRECPEAPPRRASPFLPGDVRHLDRRSPRATPPRRTEARQERSTPSRRSKSQPSRSRE